MVACISCIWVAMARLFWVALAKLMTVSASAGSVLSDECGARRRWSGRGCR
jgi:hypothetical protein